jgi:pimeloyl-ACP methyl ester carboxylesterase
LSRLFDDGWTGRTEKTQPRLLVVWGKYDPSFDIFEPEAYRKDVPSAEVHILDAGHFALDTAADQIADLARNFLNTKK